MATFSFRLETVLHVRKAERDQCRAALAQALASLESIERRITAIKDELRALALAQPSGHGAHRHRAGSVDRPVHDGITP